MGSLPLYRCRTCGQELPRTPEFFHRRSDAPDGLRTHCKACHHAQNLKWAQANRPRINAQKRGHRKVSNPEFAAKIRAYRAANREALRAYHHDYALENRDALREQYRVWAERNRDRLRAVKRAWSRRNLARVRAHSRATQARRRAAKRSSPAHYTADDVARQLQRQQDKCWWCQRPCSSEYEVDHLIPLARGGTNGPENIVISCRPCNRKRGAKLPHEWTDRLL